MTVSGFTPELLTLENTGGAFQMKAFDICCALCILRLIISIVPVSRQNFRSETKKYSSNGCSVDFKRDY